MSEAPQPAKEDEAVWLGTATTLPAPDIPSCPLARRVLKRSLNQTLVDTQCDAAFNWEPISDARLEPWHLLADNALVDCSTGSMFRPRWCRKEEQ